MKHELLYETNDSFIQKEGNDDKVTSIVPGVAYIKDIEEPKYNNSLGILTVFYDVADTSEATKIFTSDGIKNNLVEAVIEKNRISPSELTQEYQFAEAGKHAVRFIYSPVTLSLGQFLVQPKSLDKKLSLFSINLIIDSLLLLFEVVNTFIYLAYLSNSF